MGNSTKTLQSIFDSAKAKGIPVPTQQPGGDGVRLALTIGNDVMSAIVAERFNPKWNRATAPSFYTNSWQQDYPQLGLSNIGWGEDVDKVDINNTAFPKPTNSGTAGGGMTWRRQLSRSSLALRPVCEICWMYNQDMVFGMNQAILGNPASWGAASWPGNGVTFNPQITAGPVVQNPIMSMIDANGNLLIVAGQPLTAPQTTAPVAGGTAAPVLAIAAGGVVTLYVLGAPPAWLVAGVNIAGNVNDARLNTPAVRVSAVTPGVVIGGQTYYAVSYPLAGVPTIPAVVNTTAESNVGSTGIPINVIVLSIAGMTVGGLLVVDTGGSQETVAVTVLHPATPSFEAIYTKTHTSPFAIVSQAQEAVTGTITQYSGAPLLPAGSAEGATFIDGSVTWVVVAPMSQGFRVSPLPGAAGPVYQITPYYQMLLEEMTSLQDVIDPIPNDQKYIFQTGVEWMCKMGSPNPGDRAEAMKQWPLWLESLVKLLKQNDREVDGYGAIPAESAVESVYGWRGHRNPQDPGQPY